MPSCKTYAARSVLLAFALIAPGSIAVSQEEGRPRLMAADQEACGDPLLESQVWEGVTGIVDSVIGPTAIRMVVTEPPPRELTVKLVGVRVPIGKKATRDAIAFLQQGTVGHEVTVLLNPSDKYFARQKIRHVDGWLGEVSVAMIERGVAAYESPKPYQMSHYDACRHRLAEGRARIGRVGIWEWPVSRRLLGLATRYNRAI